MLVAWSDPTATDNSGEQIIVENLSDINSPVYLTGGLTTVKYFAADSSGNNATCDLKLFVEGRLLFFLLSVKVFSCTSKRRYYISPGFK